MYNLNDKSDELDEKRAAATNKINYKILIMNEYNKEARWPHG